MAAETLCPNVNIGILGFSDAMDEPQNQVSENDPLTISRNSIPVDLFISIFLRLSVKSIAMCRCVSKQWASILTNLFLKISSTRPCLLFTFALNGKWLFFSAPVNSDQSSSPVAADRHMTFPNENGSYGISRPVCGLLCSLDRYDPFICNPSTGQYVTLPKVTTGSGVSTYFGYDPIDKLFKVLRMSNDYYWVLTLGTGQVSWRMIECSISHCSISNGICINGVVYYLAAYNGLHRDMLVCFDVRLEKFNFLDMDNMIWGSTLINFKGKLGAVLPDDEIPLFSKRSTRLELWVLDDVENQKWSKHIYELPSLWKNLVGDNLLHVVGMTGKGEIVFSPYYLQDHFYIFYYHAVKNTVVRIEINLGIVVPDYPMIYTFIDHVEDVKLMEMLESSFRDCCS